MRKPTKNYAFIDGSYNPATNVYGCGGFLVDQYGLHHVILDSGNDPEKAKMRNVAGEILGAMAAISLASDLNMERLTIFHDYEGIAAWPKGRWKCKKHATREYAMFVWKMMDAGMRIYFQHVRGHSGIDGNEEADKLAKIAVGLEVK